jgi:hypothetical protein
VSQVLVQFHVMLVPLLALTQIMSLDSGSSITEASFQGTAISLEESIRRSQVAVLQVPIFAELPVESVNLSDFVNWVTCPEPFVCPIISFVSSHTVSV